MSLYVQDPPESSGFIPDAWAELTTDDVASKLRLFSAASEVTPRGRYRHWDNLRQLTPPKGLTAEEWWAAVKFARRQLYRKLPLKDSAGAPFVYVNADEALELLHFIDQHASGEILMPEAVTEDQASKKHSLVNSFIEEAIRSSQLEGATTSRVVAKEMIRSGRQPRDRSERMILNNFRALEFMHEEMGAHLTPQVVIELQRILTEDTLDDPNSAGRLQNPQDERVKAIDLQGGRVLHNPPPATQLPKRMQQMCDFANGGDTGKGFLHPVVRAILLHFWLAYDHPFEDGNGRTARALFYWSLKTQGYWVVEYLSISRILREAPSKYVKAFLLTETDDRDTTYFILYQLQVIKRAIHELHDYLQRKISEVREFEHVVEGTGDFNYRQLALLRHAVRHPHQRYTFKSHSVSHKVTHQTARVDLLTLHEKGLLNLRKAGRRFVFTAVEDLAQKLRRGQH